MASQLARLLPFLALLLGALAAIWLLVLGPGYRLGVWGYPAAYGSLKFLVPLGAGAAALGLLAMILRRGFAWPAALGVVLGLAAAAFPLRLKAKADAVPPIHDISTDLTSPPTFQAVLPLRAEAENTTEHGGAELAEQQRAAYPDLAPWQVAGTPAAVLTDAAACATAEGWTVHAQGPRAGGEDLFLEATEATPWWGYQDDVVVRIRPGASPDTSLVDVRSVSRVGTSDLGKNAERIRAFLAQLTARPGRAGAASPR